LIPKHMSNEYKNPATTQNRRVEIIQYIKSNGLGKLPF